MQIYLHVIKHVFRNKKSGSTNVNPPKNEIKRTKQGLIYFTRQPIRVRPLKFLWRGFTFNAYGLVYYFTTYCVDFGLTVTHPSLNSTTTVFMASLASFKLFCLTDPSFSIDLSTKSEKLDTAKET